MRRRARLETIHRRGPPDTSRNRFIVVALRDQPHRYVQCIFQDRDRQMLCEAAPGAYGPSGGDRLQLDADALAALKTLAFVQADPHEIFSRTVDLGSPPDVGIAAALMLAALYDVYGARGGTPLMIEGPVAAIRRRSAARPPPDGTGVPRDHSAAST